MRIITEQRLKQFVESFPDTYGPLAEWRRLVKAAEWTSLGDVRRVYPNADSATVASGRTVTIFNVKGNNYRLITAIHYNTGTVYVMRLLTHAQYSKGRWKDQL
jgi:mRNA interferase HigB